MASKIPDVFHVFGSQLNAFIITSVGIFLKYFRRKLLQFEWSKTVSNLGMFRCKLIVYISDEVVFRLMLLLHELYITPLQISHMLKINSFSITQQKTSWMYSDIAELQDFIVS